ncbi:hypothetical protein [Luteipulveratus halotolerans]|nr:hypothetical protein [Luteipulveratus halotolerans]
MSEQSVDQMHAHRDDAFYAAQLRASLPQQDRGDATAPDDDEG